MPDGKHDIAVLHVIRLTERCDQHVIDRIEHNQADYNSEDRHACIEYLFTCSNYLSLMDFLIFHLAPPYQSAVSESLRLNRLANVTSTSATIASNIPTAVARP